MTDFGLSKEGVVGDTITSICGTPEYLAPEILRKRAYGVAVDWWSLGTLLYEMIAGLPPFYDRNRQVMYRKILEGTMEPPPFMSPEAIDVCSKLLVREPTARLGYRGCEEIMAHPFFACIDWGKLDRREIPPPWLPAVTDATDTRNIASEFTSEPAAVSMSPAGSKLRDLTGGETPPSFTDFTFTHQSVLDGNTYRVSFTADDDSDEEGMVREGSAGAAASAAARHGAAAGADGSDGGEDGGPAALMRASSESDFDGTSLLGKMEGLKVTGGGGTGKG